MLGMNEALLVVPSDDEIKSVVFQLGDDKVPEPDGFSSLFYQRNWNVVEPSLC